MPPPPPHMLTAAHTSTGKTGGPSLHQQRRCLCECFMIYLRNFVVCTLMIYILETIDNCITNMGKKIIQILICTCFYCVMFLGGVSELYETLCVRALWLWALWPLCVSFALLLVVLSFYLFLRSRCLVWVFYLHMIGVESVLPFLEGSCVLVSVVLRYCPCLWGPRLLISRDLVPAFSLGFWICWMSFFFFIFFLNFCTVWICRCCQCTHQRGRLRTSNGGHPWKMSGWRHCVDLMHLLMQRDGQQMQ